MKTKLVYTFCQSDRFIPTFVNSSTRTNRCTVFMVHLHRAWILAIQYADYPFDKHKNQIWWREIVWKQKQGRAIASARLFPCSLLFQFEPDCNARSRMWIATAMWVAEFKDQLYALVYGFSYLTLCLHFLVSPIFFEVLISIKMSVYLLHIYMIL